MAYLTDTEKRLLFAALSREKEVCKEVDKSSCREPYEQSLVSIVESLESKFYYDRFEREIRLKAIADFADKLYRRIADSDLNQYKDTIIDIIGEVVEEVKR